MNMRTIMDRNRDFPKAFSE
ncbi:hypothetical protein Ga0076813_11875, partial [endosymbiont of Ridgeia piscesae]